MRRICRISFFKIDSGWSVLFFLICNFFMYESESTEYFSCTRTQVRTRKIKFSAKEVKSAYLKLLISRKPKASKRSRFPFTSTFNCFNDWLHLNKVSLETYSIFQNDYLRLRHSFCVGIINLHLKSVRSFQFCQSCKV